MGICKKCGKELNNNQKFCNNCGEKNEEYAANVKKLDNIGENRNSHKKNRLLGIGVVLAIIVIAIIVTIILMNKKVEFEVEDFSLSKETTDYEYIDNYTYYTGEGTIKTKDKKGTYMVLVEPILVSGGNRSKETTPIAVLVTEGEGKFTTYDSGDVDTIKKPKYKFEIVGYIKFK